MVQTTMVVASNDKTMPARYVGMVLPNYYCRGWNAKRLKYCRHRAGAGTTHPGEGRCKFHGGRQQNDARVTHGRYSSIQTPRLRELLDAYAEDTDPLNVIQDLHLVRALITDYIERAGTGGTAKVPEAKLLNSTLDEYEIALGEEATDAQREQLEAARAAIAALTAERALPDIAEAVRFLDVVSKMVHRLEMLRTAGAVSLDQVRRFLAAVDRELQLYVTDEVLREKIRKALYAIRV